MAIVLIVTPGPDTALIIRNALRAGTRAASLSAAGVGAGSMVWAAASVLGVAILIESSAFAFTVTVMPQFIQPHDSLVRLVAMVACYEAMVVLWLCAYGYVVSRAGRSRMGSGVHKSLERMTEIVMIALAGRLAFERR